MAQENKCWGYDRIAGALGNLGHVVSHQIGNIPEAPRHRTSAEKKQEYQLEGLHRRPHGRPCRDRLLHRRGPDLAGSRHLLRPLLYPPVYPPGNRRVTLDGFTRHPTETWMTQMARNAVGRYRSTRAPPLRAARPRRQILFRIRRSAGVRVPPISPSCAAQPKLERVPRTVGALGQV